MSFISVESQVSGAKELIKGMDISAKTIERKVLSSLATGARTEARRGYRSLLKKRSGNLYKNIIKYRDRRGNYVISANGKNENGYKYGYALAHGFTITPKNDEFLTFKIGDRWVKLKEVTVQPRDFVESPVRKYLNSPASNERAEKVVQREIQKLEEKAKQNDK